MEKKKSLKKVEKYVQEISIKNKSTSNLVNSRSDQFHERFSELSNKINIDSININSNTDDKKEDSISSEIDDDIVSRLKNKISSNNLGQIILNTMVENRVISPSDKLINYKMKEFSINKSSNFQNSTQITKKSNYNLKNSKGKCTDNLKFRKINSELDSKKSPEKKIVETFNRLISDSNRRFLIKKENQFVSGKQTFVQKQKKFSQKNFEKFYQEKVLQPFEMRNRYLDIQRFKKAHQEKEKEDFILKQKKVLKKPEKYIDSIFSRLMQDANKRKSTRDISSKINETLKKSKTQSKDKTFSKRNLSKNSFNFDYKFDDADQYNYNKESQTLEVVDLDDELLEFRKVNSIKSSKLIFNRNKNEKQLKKRGKVTDISSELKNRIQVKESKINESKIEFQKKIENKLHCNNTKNSIVLTKNQTPKLKKQDSSRKKMVIPDYLKQTLNNPFGFANI